MVIKLPYTTKDENFIKGRIWYHGVATRLPPVAVLGLVGWGFYWFLLR